ncbi:MAG TPA: hypothetical protein VIK25_09090, partial [Gemmatimonadaceae bacterium]
YFAAFSVVSARERRAFWSSMPSRTLLAALGTEALIGTALTFVGLPDLSPLAAWQVGAVLFYSLVACLVVNDTVKVVMIRRLVPSVAP